MHQGLTSREGGIRRTWLSSAAAPPNAGLMPAPAQFPPATPWAFRRERKTPISVVLSSSAGGGYPPLQHRHGMV